MTQRLTVKGGIGLIALCLLLSLMSPVAKANTTYPVHGPQPEIDDYAHFGDNEFPPYTHQGININVDMTSISFQSLIATVTMDKLVDQRAITSFWILANGRVVDMFEPGRDPETGFWKDFYYLRVVPQEWNIGSRISLQVLAMSERLDTDTGKHGQYVVGWSAPTPVYQLKPLPVVDVDAIGVLNAILQKLAELQAALESSLAKLTKAVEDIYTPSSQAQSAFDSALDNFIDKLPMSEMTEKTEELNNKLQDSINQLQDPDSSDLKLGGRFRLIPELPESEVAFLDVSEYRDFIKTFRMLMEAMLWIYFFQMLMNRFTPKTTI